MVTAFSNRDNVGWLARSKSSGERSQTSLNTGSLRSGPPARFRPRHCARGFPDLVAINDDETLAEGEITHLTGRILDAHRGIYLHKRSDRHAKRDGHFQGFGRNLTAATGGYYFRTIKPVPYPGRTPHIHFAVKIKGREQFTTQCYIQDEPHNARDGILNGIRDSRQREAVLVDFAPLPGANNGELAARFDIVLGWTPEA